MDVSFDGPADPKPEPETTKTRLFHGQISVLHILVVLMSMGMTLAAYQFSRAQAVERIEQRFETSKNQVVSLIKDRMANYEDALWAGVSAIESHGGDVTLDQWRIFASNLRIESRYPGINGIGVIHFLNADSVSDYMAQRLSERPEFAIFPPHDGDIQMPISFIEPEDINAAAVGLDVAHEINRRTAALASRDTGKARISGPIILVQDAEATAGFLFYAPFYKDGQPDTVSQKQKRSIGAVYAPFVVRKLMDGLLAKDQRDINIAIQDDGQSIYDEHVTAERRHDPDPMFTEQVTLEIYGRLWQLDLRSNQAFRQGNTYVQPTIILFGGLVIEALIISLLIMMSQANRNAVAYADEVTQELRQQKSELQRSNHELKKFAYATSHDLRTPIRGIGCLAEILKEDLEEYTSDPDANPEISIHVDLILDRVKRMNDLTTGIITFSRVGEGFEEEQPLDLQEVMTSLTADFGLQSGQLMIDGPSQVIDVDGTSCRRILENLIGNAVKYHDGKRPLQVLLRCEEVGNFLELSVNDNGPGIDPIYQSKIFEIFQTLRRGSAVESTGIGLAIVKKAVEMHGGEIRVDSALGQGAKFTFQWPKNRDVPGSDLTGIAA